MVLHMLTRASLLYAVVGRAVGAYLGLFQPDMLRSYLYTSPTAELSPLAGRLFFCWTVITGSLCLTTAFNFGSTSLRRLTLFSFLFAFAHFMSEVYLFKTLTLPDTYSTIAVSGVCIVLLAAVELTGGVRSAPSKKRD